MEKTQTLCKDCIFAVYNNENTQQVDCKLGRLEKYRELGCLVDAKEKETGRMSYVIDNRVCMACRNHKWLEMKEYADAPEDEWESLVKKEMAIQYQAIVFYDSTEEDLKKTVLSLANQSIKPKKIIIVSRAGIGETAKFVEWLAPSLDDENQPIEWKVQNILNPTFSNEECIDLIQSVGPRQYYSVFNSGLEIPPDIFSQVNELITEEMLQFAMISPNSSGDGAIVPSFVHKYYSGNSEKLLKNKIEEDGCKKNIIPITTIAPNFPQ